MGVKGLQYFMDQCCPEACEAVDLREMARQHIAKGRHNTCTTNDTNPTLVVDGMACLRHWYSCKDWVCGGQWKEFMGLLEHWVKAFTSAGIKLVFFFDGVVEEQKRQEWVKRRLRVNGDIYKVFRHIKAHGEQPDQKLFCLPSGLGTFTSFALRSLGQKVFSTVQEADYEIASYARDHGCMGILGQDSDFIIYDSVPYLSVAKLRLDGLITVLYNREGLCRYLRLAPAQLPFLACLLGNDVVSEDQMQHIRNNAMAEYRRSCPPRSSGTSHGMKILALAQLVSSVGDREERESGLVPRSLVLSATDRELLEKGIRSYLLPGQELFHGVDIPPFSSGSACVMEKFISPDILQVCREKHIEAEGFMVYGVLYEGVVECSNTLEDEEETELLPQALVYRPCREKIYGLLLHRDNGNSVEVPLVKEWFVYPGNTLKEPDMVKPVPFNLPGSQPSLEMLWFGSGPEVCGLRLASFLSVFDCQEFSELYGTIEDCFLATLCLVTYIVLQVQQLSLEDMEAYLSQAVCLRLNSHQELKNIKLPYISSRAVQLGSLYVRGLSHLLGANCAAGCPLLSNALMPWHSFDGRLFHAKYLMAHSGTEHTVLLDSDASCLSLFLCLREKVLDVCKKRDRALLSKPRPRISTYELSPKATEGPTHGDGRRVGYAHAGNLAGGSDEWRRKEERRGKYQPRVEWGMREGMRGAQSRFQNREELMEKRGQRGGERGGDNQSGAPQQLAFHPQFYPDYSDGRLLNMSPLPAQTRGRTRHPTRRR
ncbi:constitutive coactivator of peroxisome proliferator-activated receptor gamma [Lampris incognitus]|uniref:constitutive coactivator of peroxisome proliferator-activated receptor gamma n=1 Tax=Lampris incognitus TaxID=2546036 RepID=UPI0024B59F9E|nr:constitutive coactivator of peroxisome proliferator-activated receptor gamma [Lampris incognitus]